MLIQWLAENPAWLNGLLLILGLIVGSFLNVVILRLPRMLETQWRRDCEQLLMQDADSPCSAGSGATDAPSLSLAYPPSHCTACNARIRPWHNIPVISYLLLRGRCADCKTAISIRYPLVELATALATLTVAMVLGPQPLLPGALLFTWALIALTVIDIDHLLLPDDITLPLLWLGLLYNLATGLVALPDAVIGAAAGYLLLWSIYWVFRLTTGKEGMGYGDFKLLAAIGAWLGWQALPLVILFSSLVGAIVGIAGILFAGKGRNVPIPFGPYLAIAGWIALLWGETIASTYFGILAP